MHEEAITTTAASSKIAAGSNDIIAHTNNSHQSNDNANSTTTISIVHHFQRANSSATATVIESYDATDSCSSAATTTFSNQIIQPQTKIILNNINEIKSSNCPEDEVDKEVSSLILNSIATNPNVSNVLIVGTNACDNSTKDELSLEDLARVEQMEVEINEIQAELNDKSAEGYHGDNNSANNQQNYISLLPTVGNGIASCDQTDLRDLIEEMCPVCGDKVSGYHYGLLTCESCKGFFKRTVQNKKVYTCVAERSCHIDKTQRKRCPYCRFQKCLEVGMKLEAVRADRMRGGRNKFGPMYKRDRARKLQILRQRQLALQALRGSISGTSSNTGPLSEGAQSQLSPSNYPPYTNMHIKQEIQIPQVSSLTSSPDSSPSPLIGHINISQNHAPSTTLPNNGTSTYTTTTTNANIQNTMADSKIWMANSTTASPHSLSPKAFSFDGINPSSTAESRNTSETLRVSPMIREFVQSVDDREWQSSLFSLLQSQTYNQCEVDLFELMCKVLDQNLFSQVDWARNTIFFKDLKVDDQMKLLQNSWSDMLVLDHLHQRLHNNLPDETTLHNGQKFDLLSLGLLGVPSLVDHFNELQNKLQELKFDVGDYICMKFLLLLNPEVRGITNRKTVIEGYESVQAALLDYTLTCYPSVTDKFSKLLSIIPEIHAIAVRGEEHLYIKHCAGSAPSQTLLMEMLHAKRK
ncbi:nuclear hormone receptor FTZ-F1 isoform X2 [Chironomus tepperi]|uniref:nuclear hormone receptor FTZ-F1 isoform X2 n=1 Tax=Chironomus tepperi TaxID=113505 RepID=UPI00391FC4C1